RLDRRALRRRAARSCAFSPGGGMLHAAVLHGGAPDIAARGDVDRAAMRGIGDWWDFRRPRQPGRRAGATRRRGGTVGSAHHDAAPGRRRSREAGRGRASAHPRALLADGECRGTQSDLRASDMSNGLLMTNERRVAYVVSRFPRVTETFI